MSFISTRTYPLNNYQHSPIIAFWQTDIQLGWILIVTTVGCTQMPGLIIMFAIQMAVNPLKPCLILHCGGQPYQTTTYMCVDIPVCPHL